METFKGATESVLREIEREKDVRNTDELFLLFTLGSQFDHLIKQALEKLKVFCLVADPSHVTVQDVEKVAPIGIILSGGPASAYSEPPPFDSRIFDLGTPVLGICLGFQLWAKHIGVPVLPATKREFGTHTATIHHPSSLLFAGCNTSMQVLESHGDRVEASKRLSILASTENAPVAAAQYSHLYGTQFHLEVTETKFGMKILENFCFRICGAKDQYPATDRAQQKIQALQEQIGDKRVLLALSGGSDSSTVAYLLKEAVQRPRSIRGIYIRGIDRPDDEAYVREHFDGQDWIELIIVEETNIFLDALRGKKKMEEKRLAIRSAYKAILEQTIDEYQASFIAQGTLYTDISETGGGYESGARKATIKTHHNIDLDFSVPELTPLQDCVKDEARSIGRSIGVPEALLARHPFPGVGLAVRIEGEVNTTKLAIARQADKIFIEELRKWNLYNTIWQAGAVVTDSVTTFTKGDDAGSGTVVALWAVWSVNGFTARAAELPYDFLKHIARRITNEIPGVGSVVYRLSDKPPATIEWG